MHVKCQRLISYLNVALVDVLAVGCCVVAVVDFHKLLVGSGDSQQQIAGNLTKIKRELMKIFALK